MRIIKDNKHPNSYIVWDLTMGKLLALWGVLEEKRLAQDDNLSPVEYDCWLQLNRFVAENMPKLVKVRV